MENLISYLLDSETAPVVILLTVFNLYIIRQNRDLQMKYDRLLKQVFGINGDEPITGDILPVPRSHDETK